MIFHIFICRSGETGFGQAALENLHDAVCVGVAITALASGSEFVELHASADARPTCRYVCFEDGDGFGGIRFVLPACLLY